MASHNLDREQMLYAVLSSHYKSLVQAGSSNLLLEDYSRLLKLLRFHTVKELDAANRKSKSRITDQLSLAPDYSDYSLVEVENLINDKDCSRSTLEAIATKRFSVPSGSIRQYATKETLVAKLQSLIQNERAHETIGTIARIGG